MFDKIRAWLRKAVTRGGTSSSQVTDVSARANQYRQNAGEAMAEYNPGWKLPTADTNLPPEQANSFLGPQDPVTPLAPRDVAGRAWDFPLGTNRQINPRAFDKVTFEELYFLAENCELVRFAIETRKDQMGRLDWQINPRDDDADENDPQYATRIQELQKFFRHPDGHNSWDTWLRMLLEQLLVFDAPCIFPKMSIGGDLLSLEVVDGQTIKLIIDEWGRTPEPPSPAYQQILKGIPAVNFTRDELIYRPRNKRVNKIYGYSQVEQCIKIANIAIRRELWQLTYFTEGTDPQGFMEMPPDWTTTQIAEFQKYWDSLMTDNMAQRRKIKFVPTGANYKPAKDAILTDLFDEWIARVVCFAFSLPPNAFVKQVNRATASTQQEVAEEEGLHPLMLWVKGLIDYIIEHYYGYDDIVFQWKQDQPLAALERAQVDKIYLDAGAVTINEVREDAGYDPIEGGDKSLIIAGNTAMLLDDIAGGAYSPDAQAERDQATAVAQAKAMPKNQNTQPKGK